MPATRFVAPLLALVVAGPVAPAQNQPGHVLAHTSIGEGQGGFVGPLGYHHDFGEALCVIGDLDGDGVDELAVAAPGNDTGVLNGGTVFILFMTAEGTVDRETQINAEQGQLPYALQAGDRFGAALAPAGDLDGDGVPDLWVGAPGDDDGQTPDSVEGTGCVYALRLTKSGEVKSASRLSASTTGLPLFADGRFGSAVSPLDDLDGDGIDELLVGAPLDGTGGLDAGALWLLKLGPDAAFVAGVRHAASTTVGPIQLTAWSEFGHAVAGLDDLDGNGTPDFAVGAPFDNVFGGDDGSVWLCLTEPDGSLLDVVRVAGDLPALGGQGPGQSDQFGYSLARVGDLDGDGDDDLAVGMPKGGAISHGAFWCLLLDGTGVSGATLVDDDDGFLPPIAGDYDLLGAGLAAAGDWNGDGVPDLLVGIPGANGSDINVGAMALLRLRGPTFGDLGHSSWGDHAPALTGAGSLVGGTNFKIYLDGGEPSGSVHLVVGLTQVDLPFRGGVMVPHPDLLLLGLALGPAGSLVEQYDWPVGLPVGVEVMLQFWMKDPGLPLGWGASNGLVLVAGA